MNEDIAFEIYLKLNISDAIKFAKLNDVTYRSIKLKIDYKLKRGNISLKSEQVEILNELLADKNSHLKLLSVPPSTGKTVIALLAGEEFIKQTKRPVIVLMPTVLLSQWKNEYIRLFPNKYSDDVDKTSLLIVHTSHKAHKMHFEKMVKDKTKLGSNIEFIFVTTHNRHLMLTYIHELAESGLEVPNLIIDEAHKSKDVPMYYYQHAKIQRGYGSYDPATIGIYILLLSASKLTKVKMFANLQVVERKQSLIENAVPSIENYYFDGSMTTQFMIDLFKIRDKIVIFVPTIAHMQNIDKINGVLLIKHKGDESINKFYDHKGKAMLIMSIVKANAGLNINCDTVIMTQLDQVSATNYHQAQHRFIRITNNVSKVQFFNAIESYISDMFKIASAYMIRKYGTKLTNNNPFGLRYKGVVDEYLFSKGIDVLSLNYEEIYLVADSDNYKYLPLFKSNVREELRNLKDELRDHYKAKNKYLTAYKTVMEQANEMDKHIELNKKAEKMSDMINNAVA